MERTRQAIVASLLLYGLLTVAEPLMGSGMDMVGATELLLRLAVIGVVVWGLQAGERWAWWVATLLTAVWTLAAAGGIAMLLAADAMGNFAIAYLAVYFGMAATVAAALVLLLTPAGRAITKRPA